MDVQYTLRYQYNTLKRVCSPQRWVLHAFIHYYTERTQKGTYVHHLNNDVCAVCIKIQKGPTLIVVSGRKQRFVCSRSMQRRFGITPRKLAIYIQQKIPQLLLFFFFLRLKFTSPRNNLCKSIKKKTLHFKISLQLYSHQC